MHLGRYLLTRRLAVGGMAEIYIAKLQGEEGFEKSVVIKRILPQWSTDSQFTAMLIDEAKIVVQLEHPNIVQVYELGRDKGTYFIAMEYVAGPDLRNLLKSIKGTSPVGRPFPIEVSLFIITELLAGLDYAHAKTDAAGKNLGIIHRDISPQNILLSLDGRVKITDFGIARAASRSVESVSGVLKGKFAYMSPEQAGGKELDQRSDLFACGIILYELLTGQRLFEGSDDIGTLEKVRRAKVDFPPNPDLPLPLRKIVSKALAKDCDERYLNAASFLEDLLGFVRETGIPISPQSLRDFIKTVALADQSEGMVFHPGMNEETANFVEPGSRGARPDGARLVGKNIYWLALIPLLAAGGLWFFKKGGGKVAEPMTIPPPVKEIVKEIDPPTAVGTDKVGTGFLSVQVSPWGSVSVDGSAKKEAPLHRFPLGAGLHRIEVFSGGRSQAKTISIQPDLHAVCTSNLKLGRDLECH